MTGEILATPIGAGLINRGAWIPYLIGFAIQLIGAVFAIALPNQRSPRDDLPTSPESNGFPSNLRDNGEVVNDDRSSRIHWWPMGVLKLNKNLLYALASFVLANVGRQALQLVIQYTSIKFSWSIARSSSLLTYKGFVTLFTLLLFLPKASLALNKRFSVIKSDLIIVRLCITALMLGASIMAFAQEERLFITGLTFFAIGWGFYSAMRSLAMSFAVPTQVGLVNTLIALAQSTGTVIAGPLLAAAFRKGIMLDDFMFGLPYMVAASFFLCAAVLIFCMTELPQDRAGTI